MDNKKIKILVISALIVAILVVVAAITHKNSKNINPPSQIEMSEEENNYPDYEEEQKLGETGENSQNYSKKRNLYDPNSPDLPVPPGVRPIDSNNKNAMEIMAPGYNKAQEKLQNIQNLRQQSLDEQKNNLKNIY